MVSEVARLDDAVSSRGAPPPFFIMGCARSGTTLVAQLLDNHPRIAVFVESMYYPLFRPDLHRYGDLRRASNLGRLIDNFREMVYLHGLYRVEPPSREEIQAALVAPTFEAVLATFLRLYALRQGKARCGEKTARHHEYLPEIQEKLPDSPIVFLMRDPRDTVFSIRKMFDARLEAAVEWWNQAFRSYQRVAGTAYLLRYEELVRCPRPALERLGVFLGEEYDPRMLEFFRHVPERLRDAPQHRKLVTPVDPTSVGRFREMPASEIEQIETACAVGMEAMGYALTIVRTGRRLSPPPRRIGWLRGATDRLRHFRKHPDLLRLGWRRWKMRLRVRALYILTLGPLRQNKGSARRSAVPPSESARLQRMNRPPGLLVRARRKLLELLAPGIHYSLKRRFWNRAWAQADLPSPRNFWFLPEGVIPRQVKAGVETGWFPRGGKVLDIGCGDGRIAAYLASAGYDVLGVDFAAPAIERARARFGESETLRFRVLDICEQIPAPGPFSALVDRGCYHGLPERLHSAYLRTLTACSRPGTRLLLMLKVTGEMDLGAEAKAHLAARALEDLHASFTPRFAIDRTEPACFNSRGDDDEAQSLPGLVLWMTRQ